MARVEVETSRYHVSWGAIIAGAILTLGLWILLHTLGMAAGLTAIDPNDPGSLRGAGIGTGIWSIIAPLIALFLGGFATARLAGWLDRGTAAIQGAVMWALTALLGAFLVVSLLSSLVGAGARAGTAALSGVAGGGAPALDMMGVEVDDVLAPINQRLQQQGLPPVTADQVRAAARDAVQTSVRQGRFDREILINSLVQNTQMSREDAQQVANRFEAQFSQAAGGVQEGALRAAEATGRALWGVFFALLLGLASAIAGAVTGVTRRQRAAAEEVPVTVPPVTTPPVTAPPRA